jgi:hypothetical protein
VNFKEGKFKQSYNNLVTHVDSVDGIAIGYGLDAEGSEFESRYSQEISLLHARKTGSGAHPISVSPGVKRQGRDAGHSPPSNAEDKKIWIYTSTPPYAFMAQYLIN